MYGGNSLVKSATLLSSGTGCLLLVRDGTADAGSRSLPRLLDPGSGLTPDAWGYNHGRSNENSSVAHLRPVPAAGGADLHVAGAPAAYRRHGVRLGLRQRLLDARRLGQHLRHRRPLRAAPAPARRVARERVRPRPLVRRRGARARPQGDARPRGAARRPRGAAGPGAPDWFRWQDGQPAAPV